MAVAAATIESPLNGPPIIVDPAAVVPAFVFVRRSGGTNQVCLDRTELTVSPLHPKHVAVNDSTHLRSTDELTEIEPGRRIAVERQ